MAGLGLNYSAPKEWPPEPERLKIHGGFTERSSALRLQSIFLRAK